MGAHQGQKTGVREGKAEVTVVVAAVVVVAMGEVTMGDVAAAAMTGTMPLLSVVHVGVKTVAVAGMEVIEIAEGHTAAKSQDEVVAAAIVVGVVPGAGEKGNRSHCHCRHGRPTRKAGQKTSTICFSTVSLNTEKGTGSRSQASSAPAPLRRSSPTRKSTFSDKRLARRTRNLSTTLPLTRTKCTALSTPLPPGKEPSELLSAQRHFLHQHLRVSPTPGHPLTNTAPALVSVKPRAGARPPSLASMLRGCSSIMIPTPFTTSPQPRLPSQQRQRLGPMVRTTAPMETMIACRRSQCLPLVPLLPHRSLPTHLALEIRSAQQGRALASLRSRAQDLPPHSRHATMRRSRRLPRAPSVVPPCAAQARWGRPGPARSFRRVLPSWAQPQVFPRPSSTILKKRRKSRRG